MLSLEDDRAMAGLQNAEQAVVGALRREEQAVKQAQHLQAELAATQGLLNANQRELQRNLMVMKFRNAEVERLRVCIMCHLTTATCSFGAPNVRAWQAVLF